MSSKFHISQSVPAKPNFINFVFCRSLRFKALSVLMLLFAVAASSANAPAQAAGQRVKGSQPETSMPGGSSANKAKSSLINNLLGSLPATDSFIVSTLIAAPPSVTRLFIDFENPPYVPGSINGQDGWSSTGSAPNSPGFDHAVTANNASAPPSFGAQSLRISNAVTSGSFGDQTFSKPLTDEAGESVADNGGMSGGARKNHFEAEFSIASAVSNAQQPGLIMSVSPDRGDGARMSFLRFEDQADGIHVIFSGYVDAAPVGGFLGDPNGCGAEDDFIIIDIATLDRKRAISPRLPDF